MKNTNLENRMWNGSVINGQKRHKMPIQPEYYERFLNEVGHYNINSNNFSKDYTLKRSLLSKYFPNIKIASGPERLGAQFVHIMGSAKEYVKLKKPIELAERYLLAEKGLAGDALYDAQEATAMVLADLSAKALRILSYRHGRNIMGGFYRA